LKASSFLGAIVVFVILLSLVSSTLTLTLPYSFSQQNFSSKVTVEYEVRKAEAPEAKIVSIELAASTGGITLEAVDDPELAYKVVFRYSPSVEPPKVSQTVSGETLIFSAERLMGSAEILLGPAYTYRLDISLVNGGFRAELDGNCRVESLTLKVNSGGVALKIATGASLKKADIEITSGGLTLKFDAGSLGCDSKIKARVGSGGVMVPPVRVGPSVGLKFKVKVASGGISLNDEGLEVLRLTKSECGAATSNYDSARVRGDIEIYVEDGGVALNSSLPLPSL